METIKRSSRYGRSNVIGATGRPIVPIMTERQKELLRFLERNRYATFNDMHAFLRGDAKALRRNIRIMKAESIGYIRVSEQDEYERNWRRAIHYELDKQGIAYLNRTGVIVTDRRYTRNFTHAALASHATASIEAGIAAAPNARLISWADILQSESMPAFAKRGEHPNGIPAIYCIEGEIFNKTVFADSRPFGIELAKDDRRKFRFFPGIEADTGTEPITTANFKRSSIFSKFMAYLTIESEETYRKHFGFPIFFVPFLTSDETRMRSMMAELERVTRGQGSKTIIFKVARADGSPGYLFTEPWQRVGYGEIILAK
jgi:hypothetical protein